MKAFAISLAFLLLFMRPLRAELLYFARGGRVQAPAKVEDEVVRLEMPDRTWTFRRSDFARIVPGHWPSYEWPERRKEALSAGPAAVHRAVWWALVNGLTGEAQALLADSAAAGRSHQPTARLLAKLDELGRSASDPSTDDLIKSLHGSFEQASGPHILLLHQHSDAEARERVELLERVCKTYFLTLAAQGIDLPVPEQKLVSVWFAKQDDYLAYLSAEHAGAFKTTNGYFHPTRRAVFAYDFRSHRDQSTARDALATRRGEIDAARNKLPAKGRVRLGMAGTPTRSLSRTEASQILDGLSREVDRQELLLDLDRRTIDMGTAAHELIHQLVAETGLAPRHADFPLWLHEGFATQFEVIRGGRWAGVGRAHDVRLPDWRNISPPPKLAPLLRGEGFGHGYERGPYAEAWALVYYLRQRHADAFPTFLDLLRAPREAGSSPVRTDRSLQAFQTAFGADLSALEAQWHNFLKDVQTPLESSAPR